VDGMRVKATHGGDRACESPCATGERSRHCRVAWEPCSAIDRPRHGQMACEVLSQEHNAKLSGQMGRTERAGCTRDIRGSA